jgi:porphobilinogen deaminase
MTKVRLTSPAAYGPEADRVAGLLAQKGVEVERGAGGVDGEVVLRVAEGVGHVPATSTCAVLPLAEPRDVLVALDGRYKNLQSLPSGARVGIRGSLRSEMLGVHRADLQAVGVDDLEDGRRMLREGLLEAWILPVREARAADLADWMGEALEPTSWATMAGRGMLVLDASGASEDVRAHVRALDDPSARAALKSELVTLEALGVGPGAPVGVLARAHGRQIRVRALMPAADGRRLVRAEVSAALFEPEEAGRRTAALLRERGATQLLRRNGDGDHG